MTAVSISHARENLFPLVRQVNEDHVVVEIVARNGGNAVWFEIAVVREPGITGPASHGAGRTLEERGSLTMVWPG